MKPRIREVIIVEGRYDKNSVSQAVDAHILETRGFGVFSDEKLVALIRKMAETRGVIVFTDSDGAGFLIRGRLKSVLGGANVKHAYIPGIPGRERRKRSASKAGLLGVEGMTSEVIAEALRKSGATFENEDQAPPKSGALITKSDMYETGLSGVSGAEQRRNELKARLGLPELLSSNALLDVLNCLYDREEFIKMMRS